MLNVLITVDTEVYPLLPGWRADNLNRDIRRDVYGETSKGHFGISYQLDVLNQHGLKAVFFVESLFALAVGLEPLAEIVRRITDAGHEIQLHLHPEWLAWMDKPPVSARGRQQIREFSQDEQAELIRIGITNLQAAGACGVSAFRAGDYAANNDTLIALARNGLKWDSSYNACYQNSLSDVPQLRGITQPINVNDIAEVPVSYWRTPPVGWRHAQLTSASFSELRNALLHASDHNWQSFVIVSHSFELLKKRRHRVESPAPDKIVVERFHRLCSFLGQHKLNYRTCGFNDLEKVTSNSTDRKEPLVSSRLLTVSRIGQQILRRLRP
jgi:peptidoglycan/xylan/chitin deacetylase (PgdA/CDA1 family)